MKLVMISEILRTAEALPQNQKVNFLRQHNTAMMKIIVEGAFHPDFVWLLEAGRVSYRPNKLPDNYGAFHKEINRLYIFIDRISNPHATVMPRWKRQKIFSAVLETVHPDDAEVLNVMKDKNLTSLYPSLTYELFQEAFPDWLPKRVVMIDNEVVNSIDLRNIPRASVVNETTSRPKRTNKDAGKSWFNNGKDNVRFFPGEETEGFTKGLFRNGK